MAKGAGNARKKAPPFGLFYGPWLDVFTPKDGGIGSGLEWAVMMVVIGHCEFDGRGRAFGWCDHTSLAEARGVAVKSVGNAAARLCSNGLLKVKEPGHRGKCTRYWIAPNVPWPDAKGGPKGKHEGQAGCDAETLEVSEFDPEEVAQANRKIRK